MVEMQQGGEGEAAGGLTAEALKSMTPEQIAELQRKNCIFCAIVSGKIPSKKLYEDNECIAVLDIYPANPGHVLVIPKEHYQIIANISDVDIMHLFLVAKNVSNSLLRSLKVQGNSIFIANGAAAGQRAPHFMIHIIPRYENDGVGMLPMKKRFDENDVKGAVDKIRKALGVKDFGEVKAEMPKEEIAEEAEKDGGPEAEEKPEIEEKPKAEEEPELKEKPERAKKTKKAESKEKKTEAKSKGEEVSLDDIADLLKG